MRIGIDCRMWDETGIGRYIRNIVSNISEMDKENEYVLFVLDKDYDVINLPPNFKKVRANIRWYTFAEQIQLPILFYKEKLDLLFVPNLNVPVLYFKKFIVTIHDLTVIRTKTGRASTLPYPIYLGKRTAVNLPLRFAAKRAKKVFAVSNYVKTDLIKTLGIPEEKILLTKCAVSGKFKPISEEEINRVLRLYNIKRPYIFYIGNAHPHKNLDRLLQAFEIVSKTKHDLNLVLAGRKNFFYERLEQDWKRKEIIKDVKFIGYINDNDLPAFYSGADLFINPSLHEGFGIQLLESFACGTKVTCSYTTSLPEVGGNIAYYFDPTNVKNIADSIIACLNDTNEQRISAGYEQAKKFNWGSSAQTILNVIHEISNSL